MHVHFMSSLELSFCLFLLLAKSVWVSCPTGSREALPVPYDTGYPNPLAVGRNWPLTGTLSWTSPSADSEGIQVHVLPVLPDIPSPLELFQVAPKPFYP